MTMTTIDHIRITGTVLQDPTLSHDDMIEFVVADDARREFIVRLPRTELGAHVTRGAHVLATGALGWTVPGRAWRHEPSRTIVQANDVQLASLVLAA